MAAPARRNLPLADDARTVDRAWRPVYAVWEITLRCDLACRHCGSRAGHARPDELSTREALDLVRQMAELGVREVTLIGGEAYLRDDWLDIVRAVRAQDMQCSTTTGARGITDEIARSAKAAGIQSASVSVDGLRATHDRVRALDGSFDAAMRGLRASAPPASPSRRTRISTGSGDGGQASDAGTDGPPDGMTVDGSGPTDGPADSSGDT
jgi:sulfatase maturation enzyme AslB (radical SAM superfamily)